MNRNKEQRKETRNYWEQPTGYIHAPASLVSYARETINELCDQIDELENQPCPHIETSGTTSFCNLAEGSARELEAAREIVEIHREICRTYKSPAELTMIGNAAFQMKSALVHYDKIVEESLVNPLVTRTQGEGK